MADAQLKQKIRDVLKKGYFSDAEDLNLVDISDGFDGDVDVLIVSRNHGWSHLFCFIGLLPNAGFCGLCNPTVRGVDAGG